MFRYTLIALFTVIDLLTLIMLIKEITELKTEVDVYSKKCRGKIVDYRRVRHTLDEDKSKRLMYHPIIRYHKDGVVHECVSTTGYTREYYKVGMYTTIYWNEANPNRIKTRKERKSMLNAIFYAVLLIVVSMADSILIFM